MTSARPANVILQGIVGSTAYGLATPESDIDRKGVFVAPTDDVLGLDDAAESWEAPKDDGDLTLYELAKFCRLALKVNPTITEVLWLPEKLYEVHTPVADDLIAMRASFLSASLVRSSYLGYATSQFSKLAAREGKNFASTLRNRTPKHARHMARLIHQGYELWRTGELTVELADPQWYFDFGERVDQGDPSMAEQMLKEYEVKFDETPTVLPAEPDREAVNAWLVQTRKDLIA